MVTELKPDLKKLPFEDFVNVVCRPMVSQTALAAEVREVFSLFAGEGGQAVTAASLQEAMQSLDQPVSKLLVHFLSNPANAHHHGTHSLSPSHAQSEEMIREADLDRDGKVGVEDFLRTVIT